ncbi:Major facilitator superfamily domain general substrate transporter [Penicillium angulare]|uniref:Major facilitator superfamily domain general substrate transporter n=1 Tax=Penicillium angulare TaxID=116970 RepID=UPI0025417702|nr:Major facilitator superfamily domain general substrate transporter [Penicillium angulare]KAJ5281481.1 Major facilitator superfamily domain general substrate transporter [Penicillium angulare]
MSTTGKSIPSSQLSLYQLVLSQDTIADNVLHHHWEGAGTEEDPYLVDWLSVDVRDPHQMQTWLKWSIRTLQAASFLSITFASSALSAANPQIQEKFGASEELVIADTALFVLAFAIGPAIWAPLSELFGRQIIFLITHGLTTLFAGATIASPNIATLLVLRFFSGAFGSSAISNAGGVVSDIYSARNRGLATIAFIGAPFLGPSLGPITCDFLAVSKGWKWVQGVITIFNGVVFLVGIVCIPETYTPVLLRKRASTLSKLTGAVYKSRLDTGDAHRTAGQVFAKTMVRPWILVFFKPIVLSLSIYMAIVYGTMYMEFAAFPIIFEDTLEWPQRTSGLSFLGMMIGQIFGCIYSAIDDARFKKVADKAPSGRPPPEARLIPAIVGAVTLPIGLFWFAWTNFPHIHWIVCEIGTVLFGFSHVSIFLSVVNYLVDAYTVYAASALAGNAVIRALFGAAFPLFTTPMYENLGVHWASSVSAFLAVACLPFPWIFYKFGPAIRRHCQYAVESARQLDAAAERIRVQADIAVSSEMKPENETDVVRSSSDLPASKEVAEP